MADSILRLKVDSQEYDNKLKRAAEGIQRYAEGCRKAGGTLTQLDEGVEQFVKELGNMETVSNSARGKIGEMTKAFTELSVQYNKLTDEEKASPFGKALSESLNTLKGRIQEGKTELDDINKSLNGGGGLKDALDQVAGKFGLNIDMVTKFGGVVGVTTTALKVAKDAFFQSESNIDEWGRTVKGAEGAYDIFLQTLNNGNWSNFFSNLSQAITGARDLYDAFDRLNSIKANNAVAIATTQAEIQQLRLLKQQGQDVDDKIKEATQRLSALQSQSASAGINAGRSQVTNTLRNGVNSIGGAYINDATLNRVADNISKQGQAYFDYMKRRATALEKQGMVTKTQTINDSQGGTYERQYKVFDINALSKEQQKQYAIAKVVTERETEIQKGLTVWSQAVNEQASNAREQFRDNRYALQGSGGGGGRSGGGSGKTEPTYAADSIAAQQALVQQLTKQWNEAGADVRNQYLQPLVEAEAKLKEMQNTMALQKARAEGKLNGVNLWQGDIDDITGGKRAQFAGTLPDLSKSLQLDNLPLAPLQQLNAELARLKELLELAPTTEAYQAGLQAIADKEKEIANFKGIETLNKDADKSAKSFQTAAGAVTSLGSALGSLDDPGAKIAATVAQAIANIALAFSNADLKEGETGNIWYWIAATAAGVATMVSTISSIHSSTGYAQGGLIKGNSYSGDNIGGMVDGSQLVGLNAGELVLNASQQSMLASNLQGGGGGKMEIVGVLSGENVVLMADRWGRRTGRGELLFGKNL